RSSRVECRGSRVDVPDPDTDSDPDPDFDETVKPETLKPKRVEGSTALFRLKSGRGLDLL
ncbi:MAG TPA: hypothetical protein PLJ32_07340, partial [Kiritimatiellia bacterium]|nr:hypothetical protein [Kiritimatiellia bacterium]